MAGGAPPAPREDPAMAATPDPNDPPRRRRRPSWILVAVLVLLALAFYLGSFYLADRM